MAIKFKSKISKMGNNRVIWIPLAMHEMIREFEGRDIIVTVDLTGYR